MSNLPDPGLAKDLAKLLESERKAYLYPQPEDWDRDREWILADALKVAASESQEDLGRRRARARALFMLFDNEARSEASDPKAKAWAFRLADESLRCIGELPPEERRLVTEYFLSEGTQLPKTPEAWQEKPQRSAEFLAAARSLQKAMTPVVNSIDEMRGRRVDVNQVDDWPPSGTHLIQRPVAASASGR